MTLEHRIFRRAAATAFVAASACFGAILMPVSGAWAADPPPAPAITPQQGNPASTATPSFVITGDSATTLACKLDDAEDYSPCTSPLTLGPLEQGQHTLRVIQIDEYGTPSTDAAVYSFEVDTTPPDSPGLELFTPASADYSVADTGTATSETSARVEFSSHDPDTVTFQCSLDGATAVDCESPFSDGLSSLPDGLHTLAVTQTDEAGNVSAAATVSWTVDTQSPDEVTFDSPYDSWASATTFRNSDSETMTWSLPSDAGSAIHAVCSLDGGPDEDCDSSTSASYSSLADGVHSLKVTVVDAAGNSPAGSTISWRTDTVAPETPVISSNRSGLTRETGARISFSGEIGANFTCTLNGAHYTPCSSPVNLSDLEDGDYTFTVTQTDRAGNESGEASVAWTVDTTPPDAVNDLASNRTGTTNQRGAQLTWTASEADASSYCRLYRDGAWGVWNPCSSSKEISGLPVGDIAFEVKLRDQAGNESEAAQASWTVARLAVDSPPAIDADSATDAKVGDLITATDPVFSGSADDFSDTTAWQRCSNPIGTSCVTIPGTSGSPGPGTYEPGEADINKRIRYLVVRTTDDGSTLATASTMSGLVVPVPDVAPSIGGFVSGYVGDDPAAPVPAWGRILTATAATWTSGLGGRGIEYRWQRCIATEVSCATVLLGSAPTLSWATRPTYTVTTADVGRRLRLLTGVNIGSGKYVWSASPLTPKVRVVAQNSVSPSIAFSVGTVPKRLKAMTVRIGTWRFTLGGSYAIRWRRCTSALQSSCSDISGATRSSFVPAASDVGKRFQAKVTYSGSDRTAVSAYTAISGVTLG